MKKIYSLIMGSVIALTANAQLVINENFTSYSNGNLCVPATGWVSNGSGADVQLRNDVPLTHGGYESGTRFIRVASLNGIDPHKPFSNNISTTAPRTIWMSFVVRTINAAEFSENPNFSVSLANTVNGTFPCEFYMGEHNANNDDRFEFGIATGTGDPNYTTGNYTYGTTYLIVIRYDFVAGSNNDRVYLWVNPSLASEPATGTANVSMTGGEVGYGTALNALKLSQSDNTDSPDADYDAFRVAHGTTSALAWSNLSPVGSSLPVVLTSFNAANEGLSTKLIWNAVDESGADSYVIEKSTDGRTFTAIGSVKATNQKVYSFTDASASDNNSFYRLKMVDINGAFKYSYVVSIKSKLSLDISLSPNPVRNNLMIQHPKFTTEGHIQIVNVNGQLLKDVKVAANAVISNIDMSGFTSGLYHIVFKNGSDKFTKTVIKQ